MALAWAQRLSRDWRWKAGATAAVILPIVSIFSGPLFAHEWFTVRDTVRVYYPLAKFWVDRVREGQWPEWYPYNALGQPYISMMLGEVFHFSRILYLILPLQDALTAQTLLCYPAAAIGAYYCAKRLGAERFGALFAAITYSICGYLVGITNNLPYLTAAATLPFVLIATERFHEKPVVRRLALAAFLLVSIFFVGDILGFAVGAVTLGVLALAKPDIKARLIRVALVGVVTLGFSLPQLLPSRELNSVRKPMVTLQNAELFSVHPLRLFEIPLGPSWIVSFDDDVPVDLGEKIEPSMNSVWVDSISLGILATVFAIAGAVFLRRRRVGRLLTAAVIVIGILMLGRYLPIYHLLYYYLPGWKLFRYPEKLVPYFSLAAAMLAALGLSEVLSNEQARRRTAYGFIVAGLLCGFIVATEWWFKLWEKILHHTVVPASVTPQIGARMFLLATVSALVCLLAVAMLTRMRAQYTAWGFVILNGALLAWLQGPLPQTTNLPLLTEPSGFIQRLIDRGVHMGGPRVQSGTKTFGLAGLPNYDIRDVVAMGMFMSLEADLQALFDMETPTYYMPASSPRLLRAYTDPRWITVFGPLYSTEYFTAFQNQLPTIKKIHHLSIVAKLQDWNMFLVQSSKAMPRAYLTRARCVKDEDAAFDAVVKASFNPGVESVIECGKDEPASEAAFAGNASIISYEPEKVVVATQGGQPSLLVLNDAYYDGWRATVDGVETTIYAANAAVRGVKVPEGDHEVVFTYHQAGLRKGLFGAAITILGLLIAGAVLTFRARRRVSHLPSPG